MSFEPIPLMGMGTGSSAHNSAQPFKWTTKLFRRSSVTSSVVSIDTTEPRLPSDYPASKGTANHAAMSSSNISRGHRESDPSITFEHPPNRRSHPYTAATDSDTSLSVNPTDSTTRSITSDSERNPGPRSHLDSEEKAGSQQVSVQGAGSRMYMDNIRVPEREDTMSAMSEVEEILAEQIAEKEASRQMSSRRRGKSCGDISTSVADLNGNVNDGGHMGHHYQNNSSSRAASASVSRMAPPTIVLQKPTDNNLSTRRQTEWEYRKEPIEGFDIEKFRTANSRSKGDFRTSGRHLDDYHLPMGVPPSPDEEASSAIPKRITVAIDNPEYQAKVVAETKKYSSSGINASLLQRLGLASPEIASDYVRQPLRRSGTDEIRPPTYDPLEEQLIASIEREFNPTVVQ